MALQNDRVGSIWHFEHFQDARHGSNFVQVIWPGNFGVVFFLAYYPDEGLRFVGLANQSNAAIAPYANWDDNTWKKNSISQGQQWKDFRNIFFLHRVLVLLRQNWNEILVLNVTQSHGLLHFDFSLVKARAKRGISTMLCQNKRHPVHFVAHSTSNSSEHATGCQV